jgi:signal transduction histidine kinase
VPSYLHIRPSAAWVETDGALVEQILRNLAANTVRYTDADSILILTVPDATMMLKFHRLLERHKLEERLFVEVGRVLQGSGITHIEKSADAALQKMRSCIV